MSAAAAKPKPVRDHKTGGLRAYFDSAKRLTDEEAIEAHVRGDLDALVASCALLALSLATKFHRHGGGDFDVAQAVAFAALTEAAATWDPETGVPWPAWAAKKIRWALSDESRTLVKHAQCEVAFNPEMAAHRRALGAAAPDPEAGIRRHHVDREVGRIAMRAVNDDVLSKQQGNVFRLAVEWILAGEIEAAFLRPDAGAPKGSVAKLAGAFGWGADHAGTVRKALVAKVPTLAHLYGDALLELLAPDRGRPDHDGRTRPPKTD